MSSKKKIMIVSGEESGERYGAMLVKAIKNRGGDWEFTGMGGKEMKKAGVKILCHIEELSVVGLIEVFWSIASAWKSLKILKRYLSTHQQDLLILIDFPDFNIRLAKFAKKMGIKILYFISPQVWAWRQKRIKLLAELIDQMIVIFPFEADFYRKAGVKVEFVGHPLLDIMTVRSRPMSIRKEMELSDDHKLIGLLPGSRKGEVSRILPVMLQGAELLARNFPNLAFIIPAAKGLERGWIEKFAEKFHLFKVVISYDRYYEVIEAMDFAMVTSGTATIEVALMQKPMVIVYKLHPLTYLMARHFVKIESFGMVNLIAGKKIVPELVQEEVTAQNLFKELKVFLEDNSSIAKVKEELEKVKKRLGQKGIFQRSAEIILNMVKV